MKSTLRSATVLLALLLPLAGCAGDPQPSPDPAMSTPKPTPPALSEDPADKVVLTEAGWRARLTPEQYAILREEATEPRCFVGKWHENGTGRYACAGCGLVIFTTEHKFDSGTGWPSFFQPVAPDRILSRTDRSFGMVRTEVLCPRCEGHLGHVFEDGPKPTGLRYCINYGALMFVPDAPKAE